MSSLTCSRFTSLMLSKFYLAPWPSQTDSNEGRAKIFVNSCLCF